MTEQAGSPPKLGFAAVIAGCDVLQLAKTTVALAEKGLARRRGLDGASHDESRYLQPIQKYVARGFTHHRHKRGGVLHEFPGSEVSGGFH